MDITFITNITGPPGKRFRAPKTEDHQWDFHHDEIRVKYVDENFTLDQLMHYMWKKYRLYATFTPLGLGSPQTLNTPVDSQTPGFNREEQNSPDITCNFILQDKLVVDLDQDTIRPSFTRTIRRVGLLPTPTAQNALPRLYQTSLDQHILNTISGVANGKFQNLDHSVFICRTADVASLFAHHYSPYQFQQLIDRLHDMISFRPPDLHRHDYDVPGLLRLTRISAHDNWSYCLKRLSCRVSLSVCTFWNLDHDIFFQGSTFVRLIAASLVYSSGKFVAVNDLPKRPGPLGYRGKSVSDSFADHVYKSCSRFISAGHRITSETDWIHMLLNLRPYQSHQASQELRIEHVAEFVLQIHANGLLEILRWCTTILTGQGFHHLR